MADAMTEDVRILCCSHSHKSILMWSHYGQKHRGIVIEFETSELGSAKPSIREILYRRKAPPEAIDLSEIVSTKAAEWSYEEEVRLQYAIADVSAREDHYFVDFNPASIKSIILGCRFSFSEQEAIALWLVLLNPHYQHVRVSQAKQRGRDYTLRFEDIDLTQRLEMETRTSRLL